MMKRHRRIQPGLCKWFLAAAIAPDLMRNAPCTIAENRGRCGFRNLTKPVLKHNNSSKACSYYFWAKKAPKIDPKCLIYLTNYWWVVQGSNL